jgi:Ca2+-dependent lipid-binding protein
VQDHFTFQVNLGTGTLTKAFDKKTGLADPYVRIGKKLTPFWDWKSQKCRNTLNPEWCETGSFKLTRTDGDSITLAIEMMDYDEVRPARAHDAPIYLFL